MAILGSLRKGGGTQEVRRYNSVFWDVYVRVPTIQYHLGNIQAIRWKNLAIIRQTGTSR